MIEDPFVDSLRMCIEPFIDEVFSDDTAYLLTKVVFDRLGILTRIIIHRAPQSNETFFYFFIYGIDIWTNLVIQSTPTNTDPHYRYIWEQQ